MAKRCWDIKICPASYYMNCKAYEKKVDCWEIKDGCLCHYYPSCEECEIYQEHLKEVEAQA